MKSIAHILIMQPLHLLNTWMAMVWLGVAHGFDDRIPPLGFWAMFFLIWALEAPVVIVHVSIKIRDALDGKS